MSKNPKLKIDIHILNNLYTDMQKLEKIFLDIFIKNCGWIFKIYFLKLNKSSKFRKYINRILNCDNYK